MTKSDSKGFDQQLYYEAVGVTDGTAYVTPWFETADTLEIRVSGYFPGSGYAVTVHESLDATDGHISAAHSLGTVAGNVVNGGCTLTARYFRVRVDTDIANAFAITVRAVKKIGG